MTHFELYLLAALTMGLLPGQDMLFTISQSIGYGKKWGLAAAIGTGTGCFIHIFAVSIGLSTLIFQSAIAFSIVKYLGVCYLLYLGLNSFFKKQTPSYLDSATSLDTATSCKTISWRR